MTESTSIANRFVRWDIERGCLYKGSNGMAPCSGITMDLKDEKFGDVATVTAVTQFGKPGASIIDIPTEKIPEVVGKLMDLYNKSITKTMPRTPVVVVKEK